MVVGSPAAITRVLITRFQRGDFLCFALKDRQDETLLFRVQFSFCLSHLAFLGQLPFCSGRFM